MAPAIKNRVVCKYCSTTFGRMTRYNTHLRTKHNFDPYVNLPKCPLCDKHFLYKSNATVHLKRTHKDSVKNISREEIKNMVTSERTVNPGKLSLYNEHKLNILIKQIVSVALANCKVRLSHLTSEEIEKWEPKVRSNCY